MRQIVKPNQEIEVATPSEIAALLAPSIKVDRVRAPASIPLDGTGSNQVTSVQTLVFEVPAASKFELRRVFFTLSGNIPTDPVTGAVALNAAGHWIAYMRGDTIVEYAQPFYGATLQVPGSQSWGDQQGPEFRNKEVFAIWCKGLTAGVNLGVYAEGILSGPVST